MPHNAIDDKLFSFNAESQIRRTSVGALIAKVYSNLSYATTSFTDSANKSALQTRSFDILICFSIIYSTKSVSVSSIAGYDILAIGASLFLLMLGT